MEKEFDRVGLLTRINGLLYLLRECGDTESIDTIFKSLDLTEKKLEAAYGIGQAIIMKKLKKEIETKKKDK